MLFSQLTKPHLRPSRLKILRWLQEDTIEPHALEAFEGLLEGLSGLEVLHIELNHMRSLPKPSTLTHHGKTLKSLFVCSSSGLSVAETHMYEIQEFDEICTNCKELRQLSVTFPSSIILDAVLNIEYKSYLVGGRALGTRSR